MEKVVWRIKKLYPGIDKGLNVNDIVVQRAEDSRFCYKLSENKDYMFEKYIYTTVQLEDNDFFEKLIWKLE